jgi:hypothetical protein
MYNVKITVYQSNSIEEKETLTQFSTFPEALAFAKGASKLAEILWTRYPSIKGAVLHRDYYSNLFNEGFIVIDKERD